MNRVLIDASVGQQEYDKRLATVEILERTRFSRVVGCKLNWPIVTERNGERHEYAWATLHRMAEQDELAERARIAAEFLESMGN